MVLNSADLCNFLTEAVFPMTSLECWGWYFSVQGTSSATQSGKMINNNKITLGLKCRKSITISSRCSDSKITFSLSNTMYGKA